MQPGPLLAIVFVAANLVGFGFGRVVAFDDGDDREPAPAAVEVPGPGEDGTSGVASDEVASSGETAAEPVQEEPLRVLLAGDSVMAGMVPAVEAALEPTGRAEVDFLLTPSILRDPSIRFSWSQQIRERDPDVVVLFVGTWESRELRSDGGGVLTPASSAWAGSYRSDVVEPWLDLITAEGATVVWIGAPSVADAELASFFSLINGVFAEAAADRPGEVTFLDPTPALGGSGSAFAATVRLTDGATVRLRQLDGLHLCPGGAQLLTEVLVDALAVAGGSDQVAPDWQDGPWRGDSVVYPADACPAS